jgi:hypothetical protein
MTDNNFPKRSLGGGVRAITKWEFSWLERRSLGAGYDDRNFALDGLVERGFCGPQFVGMLRDVEWHQRLTSLIRKSQTK